MKGFLGKKHEALSKKEEAEQMKTFCNAAKQI